jgi:hypothetical protein
MHLVVVQRGEQALYTRLTAQPWTGGVRVIWDRRGGERRTTGQPARVDRRRRDRRGPPPDTWEAMGFRMVHQLDAPP